MASFKSEEVITATSLTTTLLATFILLAITFLILVLVKRYRPKFTDIKNNIRIIETKTDIKLGTLAIISAYGQNHLLVITKTGTSLHPLSSGDVEDSQKGNDE